LAFCTCLICNWIRANSLASLSSCHFFAVNINDSSLFFEKDNDDEYSIFLSFPLNSVFGGGVKPRVCFNLKKMPAPDQARRRLFRCGHLFRPREYKIGLRQRRPLSDSEKFIVACWSHWHCPAQHVLFAASLIMTQTTSSSTSTWFIRVCACCCEDPTQWSVNMHITKTLQCRAASMGIKTIVVETLPTDTMEGCSGAA
jgi:hypothetical protein